jgi:hypothetical protein
VAIQLDNNERYEMGTRNLTVVKNAAGETKIAQYGQWDGYPSYSGTTALEFLRDKTNRENLLQRLTLVQFISSQECDTIYKSFDSTDWENKDFLNEYPGLHRDTGVKILEAVASATETFKTIDNSDFRNDELFCEGVYEVDFSTNKFISTYGGEVVEFELDNLPSDDVYLSAMGVELETA